MLLQTGSSDDRAVTRVLGRGAPNAIGKAALREPCCRSALSSSPSTPSTIAGASSLSSSMPSAARWCWVELGLYGRVSSLVVSKCVKQRLAVITQHAQHS